jgi:hypothetical protein
VTDGIGVEVGDRVVIGIADSALNRASVLAYLLPLVALMLAAFAAQTAGAADGFVALAGILGLALGLWSTGRLTGGASTGERFRPVILRGLDPQVSRVPGPSTGGSSRESRWSETSAGRSRVLPMRHSPVPTRADGADQENRRTNPS